MNQERKPETRMPGGARKPYRKPRLVEYGSIAKLTQGTRTISGDGPGGGFKKTCL